MATEQPIVTAPDAATGSDPEKTMANLENAMDDTRLQDAGASPELSEKNGTNGPTMVNGTSEVQTAPAVGGAVEPKPTAALNLPLSSIDGPIKTPLGAPLQSSEPKQRPDLTSEQEEKYKTMLANVEKWTEVPETSVRGAGNTPLEDDERMFLTRDCLLRYLRADKWNVSAAETRLKNTLIWRREYGIKKITSDYVGIENETGKQLIIGWDNEGRTCQYMRPSKQNTERGPRQIEHLVYMLERSIDLMPAGQETLTLLINFAETKSGQGATLAQGKQTLNILQNHYPERLGRALVTNVPFYIWGFFKLITPFIDPLTREKIKFNEDSGLHVPREQLLKESGGLVEFDYDHSVYWPALTQLADQNRAERKARWEKAGKRVGEYEMYLKRGQDKCLADLEKESVLAAAVPEV
ncbi:uncharacterized protein HMPREF1541_09689 [Cyphellophora europaea CBS 101466]|uniref:CRAL-TRIO domain-containing protein n=1 Tax=Cyphellophora europaea (strain CBS 101466) TaxID=1220924 RepID=W2SA80_CYPE1|nr:uncharacterized protein HMPREF1541_09689 [Cyphellophora europaea CBS 101466]ETN44814.1 hypothetical protein HMPREF1541_09689 [Cyphellophora europaea CBS 101466]